MGSKRCNVQFLLRLRRFRFVGPWRFQITLLATCGKRQTQNQADYQVARVQWTSNRSILAILSGFYTHISHVAKRIGLVPRLLYREFAICDLWPLARERALSQTGHMNVDIDQLDAAVGQKAVSRVWVRMGVALATLVLVLYIAAERAEVDWASLATGEMARFEYSDREQNADYFAVLDVNGETWRSSDFDAPVTVINYWATWCAPCRDEMPGLNDLQARFSPGRLRIIAVSLDVGGFDEFLPFTEELKLDQLAFYWDPTISLPGKEEIIGLPGTILLNEAGQVMARISGPVDWSAPEVTEFFRTVTR